MLLGPRTSRLSRWIAATLCALSLLACREEEPEAPVPAPASSDGDEVAVRGPAYEHVETVDLLAELPFCAVRHRGLSIDTGSTWGQAHRSFHAPPFGDILVGRRAGHGTGRVRSSRLVYDFWLDRATKGVRVGMRAQGDRASIVSAYVDDRRIGDGRLRRANSELLDWGPISAELSPGRHTVTLSFNRTGSGEQDAALIDWLRVYLPDNIEEQYAAPTAATLVTAVELGGEPRRSLLLRQASSIRCPFVPGPGARVKVDVGFWGEGDGEIEVRALIDQGRAVTLAERNVTGGDGAHWTTLDVSLDAVPEGLVVLELAARSATGTGRVAFGEPKLIRVRETPPPPRARTVVVVVVSGIARDLVPPWADRKGLPSWFSLSEQGTAFEGYRVSSTLVGGVVASLLTGLPASRHGLVHTSASLLPDVPLLSRAIREIGGRSAFFTNVPYSFGGFGFERDWNRFEQMSPVRDLPTEEPLRRAQGWLQAEFEEDSDKRRLLVVHLRGGHPPFDVTPEDASSLSPPEYTGSLEPRRAAIILRNVRERERRTSRKLGPKDWQRLIALQRAALLKQDAALGALFETLRAHGRWDDSLVILLGDVARGEEPHVPFEPYGELREDRLSPPLLLKFPYAARPAPRSAVPLGTLDVSRAIHDGLGLDFPGAGNESRVVDLAQNTEPLATRGLVAVHPPSYVFTLDRYRLAGSFGQVPLLCDLEVDPACQHDLYSEAPFQMEWLWRMAVRAFQTQGATQVEDATLGEFDEDLRAALTVFGL
jgi:hypothetical protein